MHPIRFGWIQEPPRQETCSAAEPLHDPRPDAGSRGPDSGAAVGRLGRQRDQDRGAGRDRYREGHGGRAAWAGLPEHASQQARDHAEPQARGGAAGVPAHGGACGRGGGELPARCEDPARCRLRQPGGGEPAGGPCEHLGVWAGRPLCEAAGVRPDRAGDGGADECDGAAGAGAGAGGDPGRGPDGRVVYRDRGC